LPGCTGRSPARYRHRKNRRVLPALGTCLILALLLAAGPRLLFPIGYRDEIRFAAREQGLDHLLVAAIGRVESNFRPEAVSPAGAVGVMQLMPDTARWVAETSRYGYNEQDLVRPDRNIRLGCTYFSGLLTRYGGNRVLAAAAYNSGPSTVDRWLEKGLWDGTLRDARSIPYPETRSYVIKVEAFYGLYRMIYGLELPEGSAALAAVRDQK